MDDSALTSQAIAELMREMSGQSNTSTLGPQERKINPLGKANKRFLGRTINTALRHNKRETERTQASCQQKLQELDDCYARRQHNVFYNRKTREESGERSERRSRSKRKMKRSRHRSHSSSSSEGSIRKSRSHSRSRRRKHKKKHRKKQKKSKKKRHHSRSRSTSSEPKEPARNEYYVHSHNLAMAVAMAYSQALCKQQAQSVKQPSPPASPSSDIIRELMSDDETGCDRKQQPDALSIASSSDEVCEILTIDVSSQEEESSGSTATESDSESEAGSCIAVVESGEDDLPPNSSSDIEIVEPEQEQVNKAAMQSEICTPATTVDLTSVDLTDD